MFEKEQTDWWDDLSKKEQNEINKGLEQVKKGEYIDNDDVMKRFHKWH